MKLKYLILVPLFLVSGCGYGDSNPAGPSSPNSGQSPAQADNLEAWSGIQIDWVDIKYLGRDGDGNVMISSFAGILNAKTSGSVQVNHAYKFWTCGDRGSEKYTGVGGDDFKGGETTRVPPEPDQLNLTFIDCPNMTSGNTYKMIFYAIHPEGEILSAVYVTFTITD